MPARIVVVHDDPEFLENVATALRVIGHDVMTFVDPMVALDALDAARTIELLITRVAVPVGKPNGVSLARMARHRRPEIRVIFAALPEYEEDTMGLGKFMALPVALPELVAMVELMLADEGKDIH